MPSRHSSQERASFRWKHDRAEGGDWVAKQQQGIAENDAIERGMQERGEDSWNKEPKFTQRRDPRLGSACFQRAGFGFQPKRTLINAGGEAQLK